MGRPKGLTERDLFAYVLANTDTSDPDGCWLSLLNPGAEYPTLMADGKVVRLNRWVHSYVNTHDPMSAARPMVLHWCGNKRCIRPSHLRAGTRADNWADAIRLGERRAARCGTSSGYRTHRHRGESACSDCLEANRQNWRSRKGVGSN